MLDDAQHRPPLRKECYIGDRYAASCWDASHARYSADRNRPVCWAA